MADKPAPPIKDMPPFDHYVNPNTSRRKLMKPEELILAPSPSKFVNARDEPEPDQNFARGGKVDSGKVYSKRVRKR